MGLLLGIRGTWSVCRIDPCHVILWYGIVLDSVYFGVGVGYTNIWILNIGSGIGIENSCTFM